MDYKAKSCYDEFQKQGEYDVLRERKRRENSRLPDTMAILELSSRAIHLWALAATRIDLWTDQGLSRSERIPR